MKSDTVRQSDGKGFWGGATVRQPGIFPERSIVTQEKEVVVERHS